MKKPAAVVAAEQMATSKAEAVAAAKVALALLEQQHAQAMRDVRAAQEASDADLPQCREVVVSWHSGKEIRTTQVVIERRTPSGMLIVRERGDPYGLERRFKWGHHVKKFISAERSYSMASDRRELRDVPAEYIPK